MDSMSYQARVERRRESRFEAEIDAILSWDGINQPVKIRNLSIYGALITGIWMPPIGEWITLIAEGLEVCGTVIWEGPDRRGLLFSHPVDPLAIIAQSRVHQGDQQPIVVRDAGLGSYA